MARRQIGAALAAMALCGLMYGWTLLRGGAVPAAGERITQTVSMPALNGTAVRMDFCESARQARVSAAALTERGSAGYLHYDGGWHVLGTMLDSAGEAEEMCGRLVRDGVQADCYECEGRSLTLNLAGDAQQIAALTAAICAVDAAALQPCRIAAQLDGGQISQAHARGLIAALSGDLEAAQADFRDTGAQGDFSAQLDALLSRAIAALRPLTQDAERTATALSGQMRCAGLNVWFAREEMIGAAQQKIPPGSPAG